MILVKPSFEVVDPDPFDVNAGVNMLKRIERAGRTCYKSEDKATDTSCFDFVKMIVDRGHEAVLEHEKVTVRLVVDRGVSHELVRHRLASFCQESTRYCRYGEHVRFVIPPWCDQIKPEETKVMSSIPSDRAQMVWYCSMLMMEENYLQLLGHGWRPEQARSVLPTSLATEIVITANLREWRHILKLRTHPAAHPQMREIMLQVYHALNAMIPVVFNDI